MANQILTKLNNFTDIAMDDVHMKIQKIYKLLRSEITNECQLTQNIKNQIFDLIKLIENILCQNNPKNNIECFLKIDQSDNNNILLNFNEICVSNLIKFKFENFIRNGRKKKFAPILKLLKRIGDMNSIFSVLYQINEIKCLSKAIEFLSQSNQSTNFLSKAKTLLQLLIKQRERHLSRRMSLIAQQEKHHIAKFLSCPNINLYFESNDCGEALNTTTSTVVMESIENKINGFLQDSSPNTSTTPIHMKLENEINRAMENATPSQILTAELEKEINCLLTKLKATAALQQTAMRDISKAIIFCMSEGNLNRIHLEAERILLMLNLHYFAFADELNSADSSMQHGNLSQCEIKNLEFYFDPKNLDASYNHWFIIVINCGSNVFVSEILSADEYGSVQCLDQIQLKNLKESDELSVELYSCKIMKNKFWILNKIHQIFNTLKLKEIIGDNHKFMFGLLAKGELVNLGVLIDTVDFENIQEFFINTISTIIPHVQCSLILSNG